MFVFGMVCVIFDLVLFDFVLCDECVELFL